ncbi:MAG: ATP-binding protein [Thermoanaerobaculia bacterium]
MSGMRPIAVAKEVSLVRQVELGLAIVKHIIELHRGVVEVSTGGEGKGATFTVRIPCKA